MSQRFLRPKFIVPAVGCVWLVDAVLPVAAIVAADGSTSVLPVPPTGAGVDRREPVGSAAPDGHPEWCTEETDPRIIRRYGVPTGGLIWWAGEARTHDKINRRVVAVGHDPVDLREVTRIDLGDGLMGGSRSIGDELWVIVNRRRFLAVPRDRGVDVVAVSASRGARTIHPADSIDVSSFRSEPVRPSDIEIATHIACVRQEFDHLDEYWLGADGSHRPLTDGLTDPAVRVTGSWPDVQVVVTFRYPRRPGLVLRRKLDLFDETGRPIEHEYAAIHLMEELATSYLAPADEAVDGVLDT